MDEHPYVCQQCRQPIQIDSSLVDLTPSAYDIIHSSLPNRPQKVVSGTIKELLDRVPAPQDMKDAWLRAQDKLPEQSFVLLQDSTISSPKHASPTQKSLQNQSSAKQQSLSHQIKSSSKLFSLLSSRTDIDHPLCEECAHVLLVQLTKTLEETKKERDGYLAFEREIRKEKERAKEAGEDPAELDKKLEELKEEEKIAIADLWAAEAKRKELEKELKELELEEEELEKEEEDFFTAHSASLISNARMASQLASLKTSIAHSTSLLSKLERTNVYADAFCIGVEGAFGTINGLRFGKSGTTSNTGTLKPGGGQVDWTEVNAAWGLTVLCLSTIARKIPFDFNGVYTLVPRASFSSIIHHPPSSTPSSSSAFKVTAPTTKEKGDTYELYASTDLHLGRLLHNRRFDSGMVMFLDALGMVMAQVKEIDPSVEFPHQIVKDKIGDASIKLGVQFNQNEEVWTRALRHVLLALKILLRWMTNAA